MITDIFWLQISMGAIEELLTFPLSVLDGVHVPRQNRYIYKILKFTA